MLRRRPGANGSTLLCRNYFRDVADRFGFRFLDLTQDLQAEIDAQGSAQGARLLYFRFSAHYAAEGPPDRGEGRDTVRRNATLRRGRHARRGTRYGEARFGLQRACGREVVV